MDLAIETHDLSVSFAPGIGIADVELAVARGEVFGFLGPNGAGKTTTIRLLLDLLRPDRGEARVLGEPVRAGGGALRRRIGFLPGDLQLPSGLTGQQTLDLFARLQARAPARRDEVLDRLGFPRHALARKTRTYSTGMRQMIGMTCALQHEPELLILDEPTTGLDPLVRDTFLGLVREGKARGQTIFLSSHVLDEVERICDRVGIIHRGRIHQVGTVAEMKLRGRRTVTLRFGDGRVDRFASDVPPAALLEEIRTRIQGGPRGTSGARLEDVEIRTAALDEIFRDVVGEKGQAS